MGAGAEFYKNDYMYFVRGKGREVKRRELLLPSSEHVYIGPVVSRIMSCRQTMNFKTFKIFRLVNSLASVEYLSAYVRFGCQGLHFKAA